MKRFLASAIAAVAAGGCVLTEPLPKPATIDERLAAFPTTGLPLAGPVSIRWNDHQVPFIEATCDDDAAFALGLVHAHLRLGQMAIYRQVARGRIAEMAGPLATDIDHGLRILGYGRASAAVVAAMPPTTLQWTQRFVDGINHYQRAMPEAPYEYRVLGLAREPWTVEDVVTFGRLAGTDVNWLVWFNLLKLRQRGDWPAIWARLLESGGQAPAQTGAAATADLTAVLSEVARSGSNSLAIAGDRTASGAALMANDPHLGLMVPNTWLIAGLRSPSDQVVGLMIPGVPVFAIGRNPAIAWGGTNLRAAASDLVDISQLPPTDIRERRETIRVRWWPDREIVIRETPFGPIISDAPQLEDLGLPPLALRWVGHGVSDEISSMLQAARATDFDSFRAAWPPFALPGQNIQYADRDGNIGRVYAAHVPQRPSDAPADMVTPMPAARLAWETIVDSADLPPMVDPDTGFLASGNNRPPETAVPIGYFFSPNDRVERMAAMVTAQPAMDVATLKSMHRDVFVESSLDLSRFFVDWIDTLGLSKTTDARRQKLIERLRDWNGYYTTDSQGAVAFELLRHAMTRDFYKTVVGGKDWAAFAGVGSGKAMLRDDLARADRDTMMALLDQGLEEAAASIEKFTDWGDMHRLRVQHPLANVPILGARFRFDERPVGGTTDALMKTAHATTDERHTARYGSNARHISDLADEDANYFLILGGQDGWLNSTTFLDQVPMWFAGDYITMPLSTDGIAAHFPRVMTLTP